MSKRVFISYFWQKKKKKKKKHHKIPLNCADEKDVIGLDQTQVNGLGNQKWTPWSNQLDLVEAQQCKGPHMGVVRQGT